MSRWKVNKKGELVKTESEEQAGFFSEVEYRYRNRSDFKRLLLFATFNGEVWRSFQKVMRAGLTPGVSDVLYLQPRGGHPFFACELKAIDRREQKDGGVTPAESTWLQAAREAGAFVVVSYGADELLDHFATYMNYDPENP